MSAQRIRDEIALRQASIEDAAREMASGELDAQRYHEILAREEAKLSLLQRQLETATATPAPPRPLRRRKASRLVVGLSCVALAAIGFTILHLTVRQAGTSITGGVSVNATQRVQQLLTQAESDSAANNNFAALSAYQQVLAIDPVNITALTESGWLTFSAGSANHNASLVQAGAAKLRRAVRLAPTQPAPHLYYGLMAAVTPGNTALARTQLRAFVASHPSRAQVAIASPYLRQLGISY